MTCCATESSSISTAPSSSPCGFPSPATRSSSSSPSTWRAREAEVKERRGLNTRCSSNGSRTANDDLLEAIERYNEEDCRSTHLLREWLLDRRDEAVDRFGEDIPWRAAPEPYTPDPEVAEEIARLQSELLTELDPEPDADRPGEEQQRWLAAQLLDYHRREAKPSWWAYFRRLEMSEEELVDDEDAIGRLEPIGEPEALPPPARSTLYRMRFPSQEHHLGPGGAIDPATEGSVNIEALDDAAGTLVIKRGNTKQDDPLPDALIPKGPFDTKEQRGALRRFAIALLSSEEPGRRGAYPAAASILAREFPRTAAVEFGESLQEGAFELERATEIVRRMDGTDLFIQGPPGSGKTRNGSRMIVELLREGKRIGVTSNSHKAIHNLLHAVEKCADEADLSFTGLHKAGSGADSRYQSNLGDAAWIGSTNDNGDCADPAVRLVGGTAWLFCREEMDSTLDYLFIDEAGQISLADAIALATSATNVVLLGDPLQLAQVSQAVHPPSAGASVLEHLLGDDTTIPPERGLFIDKTWRMHPDLCRFVSDAIYEGRLESNEECTTQDLRGGGDITGTGIRWISVEHEGNQRRSPEEVAVIEQAVADLDGATYTRADGSSGPLAHDEIMVVSPYNAQVRDLREALPDRVRVGTVDKFQGQEAAVVFYSMATSSGEDVPRNMEFLFSRNRLNVAVSRARCLAVVVSSSALTNMQCRTADQMRLVNLLCRLVTYAP